MPSERPVGDAGESLLEILLALAIMGICFAAILAAIGTSAAVSSVNEDQATGTSLARQAAEQVKAQDFDACGDYTGPAGPIGWTVSVQVTARTDGAGAPVACSSSTVHQVSIDVVPTDPRAAAPQPLQIVKRDAS